MIHRQQYIEQTNQVQLKVSVDQAYVNMDAAYERYQLLIKQGIFEALDLQLICI